ncbi:MAG: ribose-phosphate diphosphokinase [Gammaproteobacteria bacterium]|nr:ribose-phosphate diphosphokinase [Gammaproteobacteria bacterium]MCW8987582.1 ribose-phosphate diphosphokinase [Gammaproteobacteria bacterium]
MKAAIYTFPGYHQQGKNVAEILNISSHEIDIHHFPDKESLVTLPEKKSDHVILYLSLDYPNNKLIELLLACKTARTQGIKRLSLVAPYLCYMRQDKSFHTEEAVSQHIIGRWLSELVDDIITVDPHLHRIQSLDTVIPDTNNIVLTATPLLGEFIKSLNKTVHLLGPDEESLQWVKSVAEISHSPYSVATKTRHSDTRVEIQLPEIDYHNQHIILIDDVISTGNTVAQTAIKLYKSGALQVDVIATHALFTKDALDTLNNSNIKNIWSSDSISHSTNQISLKHLLAQNIKTLL